MGWISDSASTLPDPDQPPPVPSTDPDDHYLIALASTQRAALVSGDNHLLQLAAEMPVFPPRQFLEVLRQR